MVAGAIALVCGAECGIVTAGLPASSALTHWHSITGAPAIDTGTVRNGAKSFKFAAAATHPQLLKAAPISQTVGYFRAYIRLTDATPSSDLTAFYFDTSASASSGWFTVTTGGVLEAGFNNANYVAGPTLSDNTWYGIEAEVDISANPNVIRWRTWSAAGGWTSRTNVSVSQAASTFSNPSFTMGICSSTPTSGTTLFIDDVVAGYGTTTGEFYDTGVSKGGKVLRYLPTSDGTHGGFVTGDFVDNTPTNLATTSTTIYTLVDTDDQTLINGTYVGQAVANAGPTVRAVGTVANGTGAISPGLPASTAAGDLLLMFLENTQGESAPTATGWTQLLTKETGAGTTACRLTVLYKIAAGGDATTTNDPGDHIVGRIIGITVGTFDAGEPFGGMAAVTSNEDTADTSGSITGMTTTKGYCLIVHAIANGDDPAADGTANYSSFANASLASITERIDNVAAAGNGGGIGVATGVLNAAGATGAATVTLAVASFKAMATFAVAASRYIEVLFADEGTETTPRALAVTSSHFSGSSTANEHHMRVSDDDVSWTNLVGDWGIVGEDMSDTSVHIRHKVIAPPSGGSWTAAKVNSMRCQWGWSDDVSPNPRLASVSLEVDWTESNTVTGTLAMTFDQQIT